MIDIADPATEEFLHSGPSLLTCTVDGDGQPHVSRAWGVTIVDADSGLLRLLMHADDSIALTNIRAGRPIALTATNVTNFHSLQFKGLGVSVEDVTTADDAKQAVYTDAFLTDIHVANGYPMDLIQRWARRATLPCLITVDSSFDQTPGPSAGVAIDQSSP